MRRPGVTAICLLAGQAMLLAWSGYRHSPTIDEPAHLAAGLSHWKFGRMDLYSVNPPLVRMVAALPVMLAKPETNWAGFRLASQSRAEFQVGEAFADANGPRIFWLTTLARWAVIPFALLGGWFCFQWARELFGDASGLVALALWCFSPTVLGNGALITADVPAAALSVATLYLFRHWLQRPSLSSAFITGVSLGLGLLTKSSLILLCGLLPLLWLVFRALSRLKKTETMRPEEHPSVRMQTLHLTLTVTIAVLILNLGYGFEGTGMRLGDYSFRSRTLGVQTTADRGDIKGNRFANSWLAELPLPFPQNYVIGMDVQKRDFETGLRSYLLGTIKTDGDGWWWFYLYAVAVKVPLGTWLLALMAVPVAIQSRNQIQQLLVVIPLVFYTLLVSSQVGLNFYRYLLPAFPFAFICISQVCSSDLRHRSRTRFIVGGLAFAWSISASLYNFPHSLAYFNELAGGPKQGYRIMADANLDWGQDLIFLHEWIEEHPAAEGLELSYYGPVAPVIAGLKVQASLDREKQRFPEKGVPATNTSPWIAISVTRLAHQKALQERARHRNSAASVEIGWHEYLFDQEPDARIGYSIHLYRNPNLMD